MKTPFRAIGGWLNRRLRTPISRAIFAYSVIALLFAILWWQRQLFGIVGAAAITAAAVWSLSRRLKSLASHLKHAALRRGVRFARTARKVNAMSPEVEALQLVIVLSAVVVCVYAVVTKDPRVFGWLGGPLVAMATAASLIDIPRQIGALMRLAWAKTIGKVLLAAVGTIAVIVANSVARNVIHSYVHVDPKFMQDFQALAVCLMVPAIYVWLCAVALLVWSGLNLLFLSMLTMLAIPAGLLWEAIPKAGRKSLWYRVVNGKRPPPGYKAPVFPFGGMKLAMRHVSVIIAIVAAGDVWESTWRAQSATVDRIMIDALVALDFRSQSSCRAPAAARVAYLDRNQILVAQSMGGTWTFTQADCQHARSDSTS